MTVTEVTVDTSTPFESLVAVNNIKDGYTKDICIKCEQTNGYWDLVWLKLI